MQRSIFIGLIGQTVTKDTFSETMGEQVSYRETFALRVVNTQVTAMSRSDHRGEFRIGGRGQVKLQYTMGEVDMSASLQARRQHS